MRVVLISLEPWDGVWRRNQHLAAELVRQGLVSDLSFVEPPLLAPAPPTRAEPVRGIQLVAPRLRVPKRLGGLRAALHAERGAVRRADVVWVNDPAFGVHALTYRRPALYDVTDDWRAFSFPPRILRRIVRAEGRLAQRARTVVCSETLRHRWRERYDVDAAVVNNGIEGAAWSAAVGRSLVGPGPHVGYIGTLQGDRLDVDLICALAEQRGIGTVHLVGPNALDALSRRRLEALTKVTVHGPVPAEDVPSWVMAMDVLVCPHVITDFTLSLDAIKAREYVASGRPVVATATSGFQELPTDRVTLGSGDQFVAAVLAAVGRDPGDRNRPARVVEDWTWAARAREFHRELVAAAEAWAG